MTERLELTAENLVSVEAFVQCLLDNGREGFLPGEAQELSRALGRPLPEVMHELREGYGLTVITNPRTPTPRGFTSNDHNLYASLGCHGGSGWEQVSGFAGRNG
jgi:hypothetical protein